MGVMIRAAGIKAGRAAAGWAVASAIGKRGRPALAYGELDSGAYCEDRTRRGKQAGLIPHGQNFAHTYASVEKLAPIANAKPPRGRHNSID